MSVSDQTEIGPSIYENWKAALRSEAIQATFEYPFITDAHITGMITEGYGPYQFINTIASSLHDRNPTRPAIILRANVHLTFDPSKLQMEKTDDELYHGGYLQDEAAALVSLCLGVRLKSGEMTRRWDEPHGDPKGYPCYYHFINDPVLLRSGSGPIIPRALGTHSLEEVTPLSSLHKVLPKDAVILVRAARLYQDGLWISESEPHLSWLMFVSALETAANHWRAAIEPSIERLKASRPKLEEILLRHGGDDLLFEVAQEVAPYMGSTRKFVDFCLAFLPDPPSVRPLEWAQHSWERKPIRTSLERIYDYRSKALHGGKPFPHPMCEAPLSFGNDDALMEIPSGLASSAKGGTWLVDDTPMLLHTFEYIVRGALLKWWHSLAPHTSRGLEKGV